MLAASKVTSLSKESSITGCTGDRPVYGVGSRQADRGRKRVSRFAARTTDNARAAIAELFRAIRDSRIPIMALALFAGSEHRSGKQIRYRS